MFEGVAFADLLTEIVSAVHDPDDGGATRIDAIAACERLIRHVQAVQLEQIGALYDERVDQLPA